MSTTDRTPIVLALLDDLVRARVEQRHPPDADLLHLSDGLALAVDHGAVAALWPPTDHDGAEARYIGDGRLDDVTDDPGAKHRTAFVNVARRLADVAASLLVRGDAHRHEAAALWDASSRLLGLHVEVVEHQRATALQDEIDRLKDLHNENRIALRDALGLTYDNHDHAGLCERVAAVRQEWDELRRRPSAAAELRRDLASMNEQLDEVLVQRDEARRERDEALARTRPAAEAWAGDTSPRKTASKPCDDGGPPESIRNVALRSGANECTVYFDDERVTVAVAMRMGASLVDVAEAVFAGVNIGDPRTYIVREVGPVLSRHREVTSTSAERNLRHERAIAKDARNFVLPSNT